MLLGDDLLGHDEGCMQLADMELKLLLDRRLELLPGLEGARIAGVRTALLARAPAGCADGLLAVVHDQADHRANVENP